MRLPQFFPLLEWTASKLLQTPTVCVIISPVRHVHIKVATEQSRSSALKSTPQNAEFTPHEDFDVAVIWHNMYAQSNFTTFSKESQGPIERILVGFDKVLESGIFEQVLSVSASEHMFCVTVVCLKNKEDGVSEQIGRVL